MVQSEIVMLATNDLTLYASLAFFLAVMLI
jgi:hypothetical protein